MNKKLFLWLVIGVIMVAPIGSTGTPDYGKSLTSNPTTQSYEPGEDTTRLLMGGGANARSGRWIWATGFESGLAEITPGGSGAIQYPVIDTTNAYMGKQSAKFSPTPGQVSTMTKYLFTPILPNLQNNRFGLEGMISFQSATVSEYYWDLWVPVASDFTRYMQFRIKMVINAANDADLYYINNFGAWIKFADLVNYNFNSQWLFHYSKLVVDAQTKTYTRFIFDHIAYPLSAQVTTIAAVQPMAQPKFSHLNTGAGNVYSWLDNVVITADEP